MKKLGEYHNVALIEVEHLYASIGYSTHRQEYHRTVGPGLVSSLIRSTDPTAMSFRKKPDLLVGSPGHRFWEEDVKTTTDAPSSRNCSIELEQLAKLVVWARYGDRIDVRLLWRPVNGMRWGQYRIVPEKLLGHVFCYGCSNDPARIRRMDELLALLETACGSTLHPDMYREPQRGTGKPYVVLDARHFGPAPWDKPLELAI